MKYFILILSIFILFSCWDTNVKNETVEIIDWYSETLETSIIDAKEVKDLLNSKNNNLETELQNLYK